LSEPAEIKFDKFDKISPQKSILVEAIMGSLVAIIIVSVVVFLVVYYKKL
jgi:hypothetical protein